MIQEIPPIFVIFYREDEGIDTSLSIDRPKSVYLDIKEDSS